MNSKCVILFHLDGTPTYGISTSRLDTGDYFRCLEEQWLREETDHPTLVRLVTKRMRG